MYASRNEYDRGVNTFSPEGRLFQVEYALGAVSLGATAIGICTKEGIVLVTEKRLGSRLIEETEDLRKLVKIDNHIACASAGIIADARTLIDHARLEASNHWFSYDERIPVESCVNAMSDLALDFSGVNENKRKVMSRPFGVSLIVGGVDEERGPSLWVCDPSGSVIQYKAAAIGAAHEGSEQQLQENYKPDMSIDDATGLALMVLRQVMEEKMSPKSVEVAVVHTTDFTMRSHSTEQIQAAIDKLPAPEEWERMRDVQ